MNTNQNTPVTDTKSHIRGMYERSRTNLLIMLALTLVNCFLLFVGSNTMMLFSATVPYFVLAFALIMEINTVFIAAVAIAVVSVSAYFACWLISKKQVGGMIAALILFSLDTLSLIGIYILIQDFSGILDLVLHIFVLYYLVMGVVYGLKLKKLPDDGDIIIAAESANTAAELSPDAQPCDSTPLRIADMTQKSRFLLEAEVMGKSVCYRRVNKTNQLIINGYVYAEVEMLVEPPHVLSARLDGHTFEVGNDGRFSFIRADGQEVVRKRRLW